MTRVRQGEATPERPWTFERWFEAQHGRRPSTDDALALIERVIDLRNELGAAENLQVACEQWDAQRKSALYAWNVGQEDKA